LIYSNSFILTLKNFSSGNRYVRSKEEKSSLLESRNILFIHCLSPLVVNGIDLNNRTSSRKRWPQSLAYPILSFRRSSTHFPAALGPCQQLFYLGQRRIAPLIFAYFTRHFFRQIHSPSATETIQSSSNGRIDQFGIR